MKTAGEEGKEDLIERLKKENGVVSMAIKKLEVLSQSEKQRQEYIARQKAIRDEIEKANFAQNLAYEMYKKGVKEGIKEVRIESAKEALKEGLDIEIVAKISKLTIEEVKKLKEHMEKEKS